MRIIFDHQIFSSQQYGGVSKYFAEVIHRLPKDSWEVTAWLSNNEYSRNYHLFNHTSFLPNHMFRGKGRIMASMGKLYSLYKLRISDFDVVHQTNFDTYLFHSIKNKPMVTTYHDVNFLTDRGYNSRMIRLQKKSLERADAVIAISEHTKKDMLQYFDISSSKITVIHHGIDFPNISIIQERIIEKPYILYVGLRHGFKNFTKFIEAFSIIAHKYQDIQVVCTRIPFNNTELECFKRYGIIDRMKYVIADEITLNKLYQDAVCFVFPSIYEGFGMPILEAMINNCPAVISNTSCFPEIASDAALYFNPNDIEDMAHKIDMMLHSESLRQEFIIKGMARAKLFSWQKTANEHMKVYQSLI